MEIKIKPRIKDRNFISGFQEALKIIEQINQHKDEDITLSFDNHAFVSPLFITVLLIYLKSHNLKYKIEVGKNNYISTIYFEKEGLKPEDFPLHFNQKLSSYRNKTYLPIISFSTKLECNDERNSLVSAIETILKNQVGLQPNVLIGLKYLISESVDNIVEHSESERAYIFAQYFKTKMFLDICIADNGISLLGSYQKVNFENISNHVEALIAAQSGKSTKNLPDAENRGFGIKTSKNLLINGLGGNYLMISGEALYIKTSEVENFVKMPPTISWKGTIIAMRIPYQNTNFSYINYVE